MLLVLLFLVSFVVLGIDGLSTSKAHPRVLYTQLYSGFGKKEMNSGAMLNPTDPCGCNSGNTYGR